MSRRSMAVVGVAAGLSAVGAVAAASIPDASNTIHACYLNTGGNLRVIDSAAPGAGCGTPRPVSGSAPGRST